MKIAFVNEWLNYPITGGTERQGACLATALLHRGHSPVVFAGTAGSPSTPLPPEIPVLTHGRLATRQDVERLRSQLLSLEIDVCIAMFTGGELASWPLAVMDTGIGLCVSERNDPWIIEEEWLDRRERLACMYMADRIHLLQKNYIESLPVDLHKKVRCIPNFFTVQVDNNYDGIVRRKSVIIASRLEDNQKQISLCIKAFALLPPSCAEWTLDIYGGGPDKEMLTCLISELGLQNRVVMHGHCTDMRRAYARGKIFTIPSRYEGFPNTLIEAMASGLPVVGFKQCRAVSNLITDGETGLLAPEMTAESLAHALERLMRDDELRGRLSKNALTRSSDFSMEKIIPQWETMLLECAESAQNTEKRCYKTADVELLYEVIKKYDTEKKAYMIKGFRKKHANHRAIRLK